MDLFLSTELDPLHGATVATIQQRLRGPNGDALILGMHESDEALGMSTMTAALSNLPDLSLSQMRHIPLHHRQACSSPVWNCLTLGGMSRTPAQRRNGRALDRRSCEAVRAGSVRKKLGGP
jgi:hypothetical protein